jgi:hypothetical protein
MLMRFLVPIFPPKMMSYFRGGIAGTIIASAIEHEQISWAMILHKVIHDEVKALRPNKVTYLPNYLAQLYKHGNSHGN